MTTLSLLTHDRFLLGTFSSNCAGGMTVSKLPERWVANWDNNLKLAHMLDDAGIDFMLPIARWIGYGGDTDFHGGVLETITWATALLASTRNITVFATIQTVANHPVVVAKQIATMAQIGGGRVGLNIVAGWNKPEYEALGLNLPDDHETRYGYAQEWYDVVHKLWTADGSFASKNANFLFTPAIELARSKAEVVELKAMGDKNGRKVDVLACGMPANRGRGQGTLAGDPGQR